GETLSYRHMVARVFQALGRPPRLVTLPGWAVVAALQLLRLLPRFRHWTPAMVTRMNADLVFDHGPAARDLGFSPRPFHLAAEDLP
ncbi:MAG: NAD(P)-dependent oxidoreductase, partial [Betaproteobacteria bacterium]|nr:NAD(P)-dependent oxidoreductase [Betaproteobacteria bacterium]